MASILKHPTYSGSPTISSIERTYIKDNHPVAIAHDIYASASTRQNWAPSISELLDSNDCRLADYLMFLAPMVRQGAPDCRIILRGEKIPGRFDKETSSGQSYSEFLETACEYAPSMMLRDIFGSIITRQILLAETSSPFKNQLNVCMYRGIFPIWNAGSNELWAAIVCAPKYAELPADTALNGGLF